jgi:hypothetical protein
MWTNGAVCIRLVLLFGRNIAAMVIAPVNESDMVLLPDALRDLKQTCRQCEQVTTFFK